MESFKRQCHLRSRIPSWIALLLILAAPAGRAFAVDAPAGYDNLTNGFEPQANMDADRALFDEVETIPDGLGPTYNAQACRECHQNPVSGAASQILDLRAGPNHPGGSLIQLRAIVASSQERVLPTDTVTTFRISLNTAGDGFVEALPDTFFTGAQNLQRNAGLNPGTIIRVPVVEGPPGTTAIGRFGWKDQHASLLDFAADEELDEIGITTSATDDGDGVPDPEDPGTGLAAFTRFLRSLKVPPRDTVLANTPDAIAGANLFHAIGCDLCHISSATSAAAGTSFFGGAYFVPAAIGGKTIHPYSDFLLHDVGTGDGIVQNGGSGTANKLRTPPLWGLRVRPMLLHQGMILTLNNAILAHAGDANPVINNYLGLSVTQQNQLVTFLKSL
jgi:CxxC motif-containing protein (DUF1111 family)